MTETSPEPPGLAVLLRQQAQWSVDHGSRVNAELLGRAASDFESGGVVAELLQPYADAQRGDGVPLRLAAALHRLVLAGHAPELAQYYPSVGGFFEERAVWPAAAEALALNADEVARVLTRPPQTNEPGRGAALVGALSWFASEYGRAEPFRLFELGSSAGLLLRSDAFADLGFYSGSLPPWWREGTRPSISRRLGCDPQPIDPTSPEGTLTLMQYVWPDDLTRLERLRAALVVCREIPATVRTALAGDFAGSLDLQPGNTTVLWHSVLWRYLSSDERERVLASRARLAAAATPEAPFLHVWFETEGADSHLPDSGDAAALTEGHVARVFVWDGSASEGRSVRLGFGHPHGLPMQWDETDNGQLFGAT